MTELDQCLCLASEPPSDLPSAEWIEQNVELTPVESDLPGRVSFKFFPASKFFLNRLDDPKLRKATVMKCSQSGFTQLAVFYVLRRIKERPVTTMWIGSVARKTQEDAKKRFWPAIRSCPAVQPISPDENDRERWTATLIMFDTMNLMIRGADAVTGLRGDPCGLIICDERADWKRGRIHSARQRLSTKSSPIELSIGAAGNKNEELHTDWGEGSQTFIHFACPKCGSSNPFRFGTDESVLFPDPRVKGGVVWDENDTTKPGGVWNWEAVKKTARFECEKCGDRFDNSQKRDLLQTCHEHHRNPGALPEHYSLQVSGLMLIWEERSFGDIAVEFLKACEALTFGDIEPMRVFVTETLGEPWELRNKKKAESGLLDRCGDYKMGQMWTDPTDQTRIELNTTLVITFDRQEFSIPFVMRQWRRNGGSRLVWCGTLPSTDELREFQLKWKVRDQCVWGDDGGKMSADFRQTCLRYGWNALKGEDYEHFAIQGEKDSDGKAKPYRQGWRATEFDPGVGTISQGRFKMRAFLWSNPWFKDKLYNIFITGRGPLWELPSDVPQDYVKEVMANEWREKTKSNGQVEGYWHTTGPDHKGDCELEQLVVADVGGLTRYLPSGNSKNK
jgi:hypothetical protein